MLSEDSGSAGLTLPSASAARLDPVCQSLCPIENRNVHIAPSSWRQVRQRPATTGDVHTILDSSEHLRDWLLSTLPLDAADHVDNRRLRCGA